MGIKTIHVSAIFVLMAVLMACHVTPASARKRESQEKIQKDTLSGTGKGILDTARVSSEFRLPSGDSLDLYLDSVDIRKKIVINDYSMIGVQYGMAMSQVSWNPSMRQKSMFIPVNFGITYTRYGKMFGYMPYFGIQAGVFYSREGFRFKPDDETGVWPDLGGPYYGVREAVMDVIEVPVLAHCHFDFWKMKIIANIGFFAGYRLNIHRNGTDLSDEVIDSFLSPDRRFDYGIKGGGGFAFVFDPVEIHFQAMYKYSMGTLYKPDYYSTYYYRYAYPMNLVFSVGLHFQLTKRIGKTKHQIRREAREQLGLIKSLDSIMPEGQTDNKK